MSTTKLTSASRTANYTGFWPYICLAQAILLLAGGYWYYQKTVQLKELAKPLIIHTNVMVTNILTNIELQTNIIVKREMVTNIIQTNVLVPTPSLPSRASPPAAGPKVMVRGYNIVPINGVKYAHALIQNVTSNTLRHAQIRFNEYSLNRRGKYLVGNVTDSTANLGPYQVWEVIKPVDRRTLEIELANVNATE